MPFSCPRCRFLHLLLHLPRPRSVFTDPQQPFQPLSHRQPPTTSSTGSRAPRGTPTTLQLFLRTHGCPLIAAPFHKKQFFFHFIKVEFKHHILSPVQKKSRFFPTLHISTSYFMDLIQIWDRKTTHPVIPSAPARWLASTEISVWLHNMYGYMTAFQNASN